MHNQAYLTAGLCLGTVFYGIHMTLFGATLYRIHHTKRPQKLPVYLHIPILIMFVFGTVSIACATAFIHEAWSEALRLNLIGGPLQWIQGNVWRPVNVISEAIVPPLFFMQDIILLHRLNVIYSADGFRFTQALTGFFASGIVASFVFVTLAFFQKIQPISSPWFQSPVEFSILHCSLSSILNALMTIAIAGRMLYARRHIAASPRSAKLYTSIAAVFVESGAIYSSLMFICILHFNNVLGKAFQRVHFLALVQATGVCTNLIILRIANGRAWSQDTVASSFDLQPIRFADTFEPKPEVVVDSSRMPQTFKRSNDDDDDSTVTLSSMAHFA